jgi:hypothetical protein
LPTCCCRCAASTCRRLPAAFAALAPSTEASVRRPACRCSQDLRDPSRSSLDGWHGARGKTAASEGNLNVCDKFDRDISTVVVRAAFWGGHSDWQPQTDSKLLHTCPHN